MAEFCPSEKNPLKWPASEKPLMRTSRRIGIHTSIAGGVENAAEHAFRLGCNTFQIFSTSPRQWQPYSLGRSQCEVMTRLRQRYDLKPLVIHSNYLINLAGTNALFLKKSITAFRGELERALALCAEYLVLHPGSFRGTSREVGLERAALSIAEASQGLDLAKGSLTVLIENAAGAEYSLGGTLEQLERTVGLKNVRVWHCNDAKTERGSRLDRHEHIGRGKLGLDVFRALLNHRRLKHAAFIAETPIDDPGDDLRNVEALKGLVGQKAATDKQAKCHLRHD